MPESPEVDALVVFLDERMRGLVLREVDVLEFRAVKTRSRPPSTLAGRAVSSVGRVGKHLDIDLEGQHLVVSLGRHGWPRWCEPGDEPVAEPPTLVSLFFDDRSALCLTDAGSWVSLGLSVVDDPAEVPSVAKLGPDPADPGYTPRAFATALAGRRKQVKAILQEQESIAGIGNAYSDEILHRARISPVVHAGALSDADLQALFDATVDTIRDAVAARRGVPIDRLKDAKVEAMRVHGRAGEPCPVCGVTIRDLRFASTTAQYCPGCQNAGVTIPD